MDGRPSILSLPYEILQHVWSCELVTAQDICTLAAVCKSFHQVSQSNEVWKGQFMRRWPKLALHYQHMSGQWYSEYIKCHQRQQQVESFVESMSPKFYSMDCVPDDGFDDLVCLVDSGSLAYSHVTCTLQEIISSGSRDMNLTVKYYAEKALFFMNHNQVERDIKAFIAKPENEQSLEIGAVLVARWFQSEASLTCGQVANELDNLAMKVKEELLSSHPHHPVCVLSSLQQTGIEDSLWSPELSLVVLETVNKTLFSKLGFHGNNDNYYTIENSFINKVLELKQGIPITLCIMYHAVARRLGVLCEPVNFPSHFLLRFKQHPLSAGDSRFVYIDVFHGGRFLSFEECNAQLGLYRNPVSNHEPFHVASPCSVLQRMGRNLLNIARDPGNRFSDSLQHLLHTVRLCILLDPDNVDIRILGARLNHHMGINHTQSLRWLDECRVVSPIAEHLREIILKDDQDQKDKDQTIIEPKLRSDNPEVKFSVGMIMKHKRYNYLGVIRGWDARCESSDEWIHQMGILSLPHGQFQPFYKVLVEDGSSRYAAEDNVELAPEPKVISHPEVAKHFEEYCGNFYKANNENARNYPQDADATIQASSERYTEDM